MTDPNENQPTPQNETSGSSLRTASGFGGAFLFVLLLILLRGGKKVLVEVLDRKQEPVPTVSVPDVRFNTDAKEQSAKIWQKEQNLQEIFAFQKQHELPDKNLNDLLMESWKSHDKGDSLPPWRFRIGTMDWRANFDWDVAEIKQRIESAAKDLKSP